MKYFFKTIFLIFVFLFISVFSTPSIVAAQQNMTTLLQNAPASVDQQQQFYVDVTLDTAGASINGIQGQVTFSDDMLTFVRAETGSSNITLWVDQPHVSGNTIIFSGVIPGGFSGQIDPFDTSHTGPAQIMRLVFAGKHAGVASIAASQLSVTSNDGTGTLEQVADVTKNISITNNITPSLYTIADTTPPTLTASIVSDQNLFDGRYTLIFSASDKESGIDHVEAKEENSDWVSVESPYVLHNQLKKGILLVRAYDIAGNVATVSLTVPNSSPTLSFTNTLLAIFLVLVVLCILYVIYKKIKKHKNTKPLY